MDEKSEENVCLLTISMKDAFLDGRPQDFLQSQDFEELIMQYQTFVAESCAKSKTCLLQYLHQDGR